MSAHSTIYSMVLTSKPLLIVANPYALTNAVIKAMHRQAALSSSRDPIVQLEKERDILRASHEGLRLELLKRRMFVAKAERVDTTQLELEFAEKLAVLDAIAHTMGMPSPEPSTSLATNMQRLGRFRGEVTRSWLHALRRRSQRTRMTWARSG